MSRNGVELRPINNNHTIRIRMKFLWAMKVAQKGREDPFCSGM